MISSSQKYNLSYLLKITLLALG
uniref:Uncharacterized protein n=1 Tax=Rhizophora mucronata TaxID=61149 RepID=A0A2P2J2Y8_RHIMU